MKARLVPTIFLVIAVCSRSNAQKQTSLLITSGDAVHFILTDPEGRRSGADPRGLPSDTTYRVTFFKEIPSANYGCDSEIHELLCNLDIPEDDGLYTIQVIGTRTATYLLSLRVSRSSERGEIHNELSAGGVIEKDSTVTYRLSVYAPPKENFYLRKEVNWRSLARDIVAMRKLGWITSDQVARRYLDLLAIPGKANSANSSHASSPVFMILESISSDSLHGLTIDACKFLRSDVSILLDGRYPNQ